MNFIKDVFKRYKTIAFVFYAVVAAIVLLFDLNLWIRIALVLPLLALGGFIIYEFFVSGTERRLAALKTDGQGEIIVKHSAVINAIKTACKEISDISYSTASVSQGENGLTIKVYIKIIRAKLLEASELTRELVKTVVEGELSTKVDKVDIVVVNTTHSLRVERIGSPSEPHRATEKRAVYNESSPSYLLKYGSEKRVYKVPSSYIEEEVGENVPLEIEEIETEEEVFVTAANSSLQEGAMPSDAPPPMPPQEETFEEKQEKLSEEILSYFDNIAKENGIEEIDEKILDEGRK